MISKILKDNFSVIILLCLILITYFIGKVVWGKINEQYPPNEITIGVPYELNKTNIKTGEYENHTAHVIITKDRITILDGSSKITINPNNLKIHAIYYCGQVVEIISGKLDKVIVENGIIMIKFGDYEWTGRELKTSKNK